MSAAAQPDSPRRESRLIAPWRRARATGGLLMIASVVLLAFNLRPAVNALGVVIPELQDSTGMSGTLAGILVALPTLCFAAAGFAVARVAAAVGATQAVAAALVVLTAGQVLRATGSTWALFVGSILALAAITFGNVLLPGLIRRHFPSAIGPMTALYTTTLMLGQTLGTGITLPIEHALDGGWQLGIGVWAIASAVAVLPWVVALSRSSAKGQEKRSEPAGGQAGSGEGPAAPADQAAPRRPNISLSALTRSPRAWAMAVFFGVQSLHAYVVFGWVPAVLTGAGLSQDSAGAMVAIATAMGIPISAVVPTLLDATRRHGWFVIGFISSLAIGYLGLLTVPTTATWLQMALIGIGLGSFPLALTLFALRARSPQGTTALSGFGQSVGYLIASAGPFGFGLLTDLTDGYTVPLIALLATLVPMLIAGLVSVRDWKIEDDLPAAA